MQGHPASLPLDFLHFLPVSHTNSSRILSPSARSSHNLAMLLTSTYTLASGHLLVSSSLPTGQLHSSLGQRSVCRRKMCCQDLGPAHHRMQLQEASFRPNIRTSAPLRNRSKKTNDRVSANSGPAGKTRPAQECCRIPLGDPAASPNACVAIPLYVVHWPIAQSSLHISKKLATPLCVSRETHSRYAASELQRCPCQKACNLIPIDMKCTTEFSKKRQPTGHRWLALCRARLCDTCPILQI